MKEKRTSSYTSSYVSKHEAVEIAIYALRDAGYTINDDVYRALIVEIAKLEKK